VSEKVSLGGALRAAFGFWGSGVRATAGILALATIAGAWFLFVRDQTLTQILAAQAATPKGAPIQVDLSVVLVAGAANLLLSYLAMAALYRAAFQAQRPKDPDYAPGPLGFQIGRVEVSVVLAGVLSWVLITFLIILLWLAFGALLVGVGASLDQMAANPQAFVAALGPARPVVVGAAVAGLFLVVFVMIRLSMALAASAAERRVRVLSSLPLTRGRFWVLLGGQIVISLPMLALSILLGRLIGTIAESMHAAPFAQDFRAVSYLVSAALLVFCYLPLAAGFNAYIYERVGPTGPPESKTS
jgi:hypothetical protein